MSFINIDITKRYPDFVLKCSLDFNNIINGIFGPSGSGKSTILNCIAGFTSPDVGYIKINDKIKVLVNKIISENNELLNFLSPENYAHRIKDKVFVFHGANDSMVPFTESNLLANQLPNSELLISLVFEHREISTNRGLIFKI